VIRIPCPYCSARNSSEFRYVGEGGSRPDPAEATPQQWRAYLYERANPAGWTTETWFHTMGCRQFLQIERHTVTNEIRTAQPLATRKIRAQAMPGGTDSGSSDAAGQPS
jgi:sarcosine oxidase subunit delta